MTDKIKYVKNIQVIKSKDGSEHLLIKAKGIAEINKLVNPVLRPGKNEKMEEEGIYELDFVLESTKFSNAAVEVEMDVELRIKNLPKGIIAIKVNASDNSDIEIIL